MLENFSMRDAFIQDVMDLNIMEIILLMQLCDGFDFWKLEKIDFWKLGKIDFFMKLLFFKLLFEKRLFVIEGMKSDD